MILLWQNICLWSKAVILFITMTFWDISASVHFHPCTVLIGLQASLISSLMFIVSDLSVTMKSTIFWDVMPCCVVEVYCRLGGVQNLHFEGGRVCQAASRTMIWQTSTRLYSITSQQTVLFIVTTMKTPDLSRFEYFLNKHSACY
jgi:hypothetical protein